MKATTTTNGFPFLSVLFIVFLVLKLCKVIDWSWWWVTAPLWGYILLVILVFVCCVTYAVIRGHRRMRKEGGQ